jgi:DNA helicase-4
VVLTDDESSTIGLILGRLSEEVLGSSSPGDPSEVTTVDILGRYGFQRGVLPNHRWDGLSVTFRTVHGSKGLEADFVIIPGMSTGTFGFPSNVNDDPVLALAMPIPDSFPHAEERRLLYVALTRARRGVFVLAPSAQPSPFVVELLLDPKVVVESSDGGSIIVCPLCRQGTLVERHGPYDPFMGCTRFPACGHKERVLCPACGTGNLVRRKGPFGLFIGCSEYPSCTHKAKIKASHSS